MRRLKASDLLEPLVLCLNSFESLNCSILNSLSPPSRVPQGVPLSPTYHRVQGVEDRDAGGHDRGPHHHAVDQDLLVGLVGQGSEISSEILFPWMAGCVHVARALGRARGLSFLDVIERAFDHPVGCESEHRVHRCDRRAFLESTKGFVAFFAGFF